MGPNITFPYFATVVRRCEQLGKKGRIYSVEVATLLSQVLLEQYHLMKNVFHMST